MASSHIPCRRSVRSGRPIASFHRKRALGVSVAVLLTSVVDVSLAQAPVMTGDIAWPGLTQDDLDRMHAAGARLYEGRSIGTVERWRSPDSKDAGEVKLIRSFDARGMACKTLDYTIRYETARNRPNHYIINWCRVQGDEWKIVELPTPR
jgi:surface antigen